MKSLILVLTVGSLFLIPSCASQGGAMQSVSSIFPVQEATVLAEGMASKLGLTALQKTSVYNTLLNYYTQKKGLYDQLKNNAITQAALNVAESKLNLDKNNALKSIMANSTQLANLGQFFGIK
ncbi:MAG: hypothetical protein V4506_12415 [Bacteroidota bacterium]